MGKGAFRAIPGAVSLVIFAPALTRVGSDAEGGACAAWGGVHILPSALWLWAVKGMHLDRRDLAGAGVGPFGAALILVDPHRA